ncbi:MAG: DUF4296 domain-containing protein [Ginsengibacter sp.]
MKILIFSGLLFFLCSCSGKQKIPSDILPPEKMKNIIWDILQAQSMNNEITAHDSSIDKQASLSLLTREALRLNQTDSVNYSKSYNWYVAHPGIMKIFLDTLYEQKQRHKELESPKVHPALIKE